MKYLLFTIISIAFTFFSSLAVNRVEANPINVAYSIAEKTDSVKIASTLNYYGYIPQISQDNSTVYRHPNGSEIYFSFEEHGVKQEYPIVRVSSKATEKDKHKALTMLNFKKTKNGYVRYNTEFDKYTIQCQHGSGHSLIFHRKKK